MYAGSLSAATDQRIDWPNQDVMRTDNRVGDLVDDDVFQPFAENLLHGSSGAAPNGNYEQMTAKNHCVDVNISELVTVSIRVRLSEVTG